jgi:cysteine desulfurase
MTKIYLDNAATTPLRNEVVNTMIETLQNDFGNPSSTHSFGRSAKTIIETSRKTIAKYLGCQAQELLFTSSATEATNWILRSAVKDLGVAKIITSSIEHHATLYTIQSLEKEFNIEVVYIPILPNGTLDYMVLEKEIETSSVKTLVSLMHVNNETGVILNIEQVGTWCANSKVLFHCDTVQSIGKATFDLQSISVDFIVASAHKFHGPKGVGFAYIKKNIVLQPFIFGGEQEKGLRAGTEATHQIAGMAKALELAYIHLEHERSYITMLKEYALKKLKTSFPEVKVNGSDTFYNILNVLLPFSEEKTAFILFNLDIKGIAVSRGSACQSGSIKPSHVLEAFLSENDLKKPSLRISFSHYNTKEEIDLFIEALQVI